MTEFELATLNQLVSYKAKTEKDIERFLQCKKLQHEAVTLCKQWNATRKQKGLEPWE